MTNQELHLKIKSIAKTYLQIEADLVALLIEMDRRRSFRDLGYASLFQYCVLELKLSEAVTSAFITVSRKAAIVPDLMEALETQNLTVSKAAKITAALDIQHVEDAKKIIAFASQHSSAETEKWLREKKGIETLHTLKLDSATMAKLKKARNLTKRDFTLEETLGLVLDEYVQKHDPLEKAKRSLNKGRSPDTKSTREDSRPLPRDVGSSPSVGGSVMRSMSKPVKRRPLPTSVKHFVIRRDQNRCTQEIRPGVRCQHTKFLDLHHRRPVHDGGTDEPANLELLCGAHHRMRHGLNSGTTPCPIGYPRRQ
ncbi:MAG: HNH endonuclease [Bdellovibrionaceae bacterium]|nr:HNH endonuclease [Pseudobdellovibrionaceae bacterium]